MSNLSQAECRSGISYAALDAVKRRNGSGLTTQTIPETTKAGTPGVPPEKTSVLNTWCRDLDILNPNGWTFNIRDTQHLNDRAGVTTLYLTRPEMETLARRIDEVLRECK